MQRSLARGRVKGVLTLDKNKDMPHEACRFLSLETPFYFVCLACACSKLATLQTRLLVHGLWTVIILDNERDMQYKMGVRHGGFHVKTVSWFRYSAHICAKQAALQRRLFKIEFRYSEQREGHANCMSC